MVRASGERNRSRAARAHSEASASHQENSVQNSNPSHNPSSVATAPSIDEEALARAYERARARILAGEQILSGLFGAFAARSDEHPNEKAGPRGSAAPHTAAEPQDGGERTDRGDPPGGGARVTLDELLPVFREPIEWALARAERHAQGDPLDLAALGRVRAAYQSRLAWIGTGGALGEARPKVRPTDLLTVAGLLVGSIDPSFARRTSVGIRESLLDALAEVIPLGLAYASGADAPHPAATFWCVDEIPNATAAFGPPRGPRPVVPTYCCRHGHVL
jgi:hypothetical protein